MATQFSRPSERILFIRAGKDAEKISRQDLAGLLLCGFANNKTGIIITALLII
jgi:hypothetical protein